MNLIRKHKISLLANEPLNGIDKEVIDFIQDKLSNLVCSETESHPDNIFFISEEIIMQQDIKNNILWCRYNNFWEVLEKKYKLNHKTIQQLIKYLVERSFEIKVGLPMDKKWHSLMMLTTIQ